jgi:glycosyltransferase involved in cell wall biosynthesis
VARFEPENHVDMIVEGYVRSTTQLPLVVVGDARYGHHYLERVRRAAAGDERIRLQGAVWDQDLLDQLYAWNASYLHGHSVGGTNPSLLRALGAGASVSAFDVVFNREVTGGHALFFSDSAGVTSAVELTERDRLGTESRAEMGRKHVATHYRWDAVADSYEKLCFSLHA